MKTTLLKYKLDWWKKSLLTWSWIDEALSVDISSEVISKCIHGKIHKNQISFEVAYTNNQNYCDEMIIDEMIINEWMWLNDCDQMIVDEMIGKYL